jgi:hypothetical protein
MISDLNEFRELLLTKRNAGIITTSLRNRKEKSTLIEINKFVSEHNFQSIDNWLKVDENMSNKIVIYLLSVDMAYHVDLDTKPIAKELANYFLGLFSKNRQIYTNADFINESECIEIENWNPIFDSTFDRGIVIIDWFTFSKLHL